MGASDLEVLFPRLKSGGYRITSPQSDKPNCIGWALQSPFYFDPVGAGGTFLGGYYWPEGIRQDDSLDAWSRLFELFGFRECESHELEPETEKIAIYAGPDGEAWHVARQLPSGEWTSKLNKLEDIQHQTLDALFGADYVAIAKIMKRPRRG